VPGINDVDTSELFDIEIPFYTPSQIKPEIQELADMRKHDELIGKIKELTSNEEVKKILIARSCFFVDFNFQKIADFYHWATEEERDIIEQLGMVVLVPKRALELGFIDINENIMEL
jgi:hypothetical protein